MNKKDLLGDSLRRDLTILIPTLNEADAIGKVIEEILQEGFDKSQILVVDGGSTDGTVDIIRNYGVKVVFQEGRGKSQAIKTAIKYIRTPYVLIMDGDYTYPAKYIRDLYREIVQNKYDEVIGARQFNKLSQKFLFRIGNKILTKFFNLLFNTRLSDVLSGMYIVKTDVLKDILFESRKFGIETEIAAHVASTSGKISQFPIEYRPRLGKKKLRVYHGFQIAIDMVRLAWRYNPVFVIFILGSLMLIPGIGLGAWVAYHYFFYGIKYYVKGIIAIILTLSGLQFLVLATLALYLKRMEYRLNRRLREITESIKNYNSMTK